MGANLTTTNKPTGGGKTARTMQSDARASGGNATNGGHKSANNQRKEGMQMLVNIKEHATDSIIKTWNRHERAIERAERNGDAVKESKAEAALIRTADILNTIGVALVFDDNDEKAPLKKLTAKESIEEKLFAKVLELEHIAERETFDGRNYAEQADGAFQMLQVLGLDHEYIEWSFGK